MAYCECGRPVENLTTGLCASCGAAQRKAERQALNQVPKTSKAVTKPKPIAKSSDKMLALIEKYSAEKKEWIKGKKCVVFPDQPATDVHHGCGRTGYIDDYARLHDIPALMDKRYWTPVSRAGHIEIELKPTWAKQMGFSISRLSRK